MALPFRETGSSSIHQNAGTSIPNEGTSVRHWSKPIHGGAACRKETPNTINQSDKMKRQRNIQQMKEHGRNPQDQTNEEEISILPEKEFRVMVAKMIQNLGDKMEAPIRVIY